jgi:hypothetical protein
MKDNLKEFEVEANTILKECVSLLVRKRLAYGPNGLTGGLPGIVIRLSDKLGRLQNLIGITDGSFQPKNVDTGDEQLEDTLRDLINYGVLALMEKNKRKK